MADDKKILVDDDWKAQARAEKERLAEQQKVAAPREGMPNPSFVEIVNMLMIQTLAGLGMLQGQGGERIPPNPEVAKHFIDMLQILEDKTKGNLNAEEKKFLDQALYDMRMRFVQRAGGGAGPGVGM